MWLRYGVAFIAAITGFILGWRAIKRGRRPSPTDDGSLSWDEEPPSAWRQDKIVALFITLHSASIIFLAILFLLDSARHDNQTLALPGVTSFISIADSSNFHPIPDSILTTFSLGLVWFLCGGLLAFPLARPFIRPIHCGIMENGVTSGQSLCVWSYFSHFSVDAQTQLIRFYSSKVPDLACMIWQPPNADVFDKAVELLGQHLPTTVPYPPGAWYRRRSVLTGSLLFVITVPIVVIGLLIYTLTLPWAWMYYTFAAALIFISGPSIFNQL